MPARSPMPVDGALDLRRAGLDRRERVRDGEPEVVVAVRGELHVADLRAAPANVGEEAGVLRRQRVADRVRQVDDRRARLDRDAADARGERRVGAGRVLAGELDLVGERRRVSDGPACLLHDLLRLEAELLLHVKRARREKDVNAGAARVGESLGCGVDIGLHRADERGDGWAGDRARDGADAFEVAGGCAREPGLDHVHAEPLELQGDLRLVMRLQGDAGRLLTVAQRRIEDLDPASGHEPRPPCRGARRRTSPEIKSASAPSKGAWSCAPPRGGESR